MVGIKQPAEAWSSDVVRGVGERSGCTEAAVETIAVERPEVRMPD